jgi:hypothetical protein
MHHPRFHSGGDTHPPFFPPRARDRGSDRLVQESADVLHLQTYSFQWNTELHTVQQSGLWNSVAVPGGSLCCWLPGVFDGMRWDAPGIPGTGAGLRPRVSQRIVSKVRRQLVISVVLKYGIGSGSRLVSPAAIADICVCPYVGGGVWPPQASSRLLSAPRSQQPPATGRTASGAPPSQPPLPASPPLEQQRRIYLRPRCF